jgi:hypothetical protein
MPSSLVSSATGRLCGGSIFLATVPVNGIYIDENGQGISSSHWIFTGTTNGGGIGLSCRGWSSNKWADHGVIGAVNETNRDWTFATHSSCGSANHLLCFEQ